MFQRLTRGLAPTNITSYVPWGLWVGFYDYLVWLEVGSLLVFTTLIYLTGFSKLKPIKPSVLFTGFTVVLMALLIVLIDLGHPDRFWHVLLHPDFGSMITWMVWLHSAYLPVLVAELGLVLFGGERFEGLLKWIAYASLPMGLALIIVSGSIFGVVATRPLWSTASLPLMFLISSLAAGCGLLTLIVVVFWPQARDEQFRQVVQRLARLTSLLLASGVFAAGVIGFTMVYQGSGSPVRAEGINLILSGPYAWSLWILHILLGVLVPLVMMTTMSRRPIMVGIAAFLSTVTFVAVTLNVVIPVLVTPELEGLATAFVDPKLSLNYVPNLMEWMTLAFILELGSLIYGLGLRFLPLQSRHEEANHG
ncbi:MAG: polysulfide reductase NrfD [Anaerolineae bacterium]|nr:polysulfide reductase NrfD [Anaerolineae bacterium]